MSGLNRKQPTHYPFLPFHAIRTLSLISSAIVSAILIYFCYHLKNDKYKIPWTFLIVLAASLFTLCALTLTFLIHVCGTLSPMFNLVINAPLTILWTIGIGLLGWNIYGTLGHVCDTTSWGSSRGIMICQVYKALFAFTVIALCASVASVILDLRVRSSQTRLGKYDQMGDGKDVDLKMDTFGSSTGLGAGDRRGSEVPYGVEQYHAESHPYQDGVARERGNVTMQDFGYQAPTEQTTYDSGSYAHGARY